MRCTLFSPLALFAIWLVSSFVHAESELAHAVERIFWWSQYQLEGYLVTDPEDRRIAPYCGSKKKGGRRCNFNEFVSYITRGTITNAPDVLNGRAPDFFKNPRLVVKVAEEMALTTDPFKRGALYMRERLIVQNTLDKFRSFPAAYAECVVFRNDMQTRINNLPAGRSAAIPQDYLNSGKALLGDILKLRSGTNSNLQREWMEKRFKDIKNFEYQYTDENGQVKRYKEAIDIRTQRESWGSKSWVGLKLEETQNNDARLQDPNSPLRKKWDDAKRAFATEDSTARHLRVISELENTLKDCVAGKS
ncbi:hypothetical protein MAPG_09858 [Magnaporthiopsis poae ATCC 64411]|uniref:Uncharacterized protein n=1 Tax=Magnaporthiopsis poae (strain ATCC 64411 / 73-15) TaxID=644358 RepID=A0A0C4EB17_MAGP6|nr:hypothetical protein MAPG_09858 [Magnaporthiopsis poae ATCC 64411]